MFLLLWSATYAHNPYPNRPAANGNVFRPSVNKGDLAPETLKELTRLSPPVPVLVVETAQSVSTVNSLLENPSYQLKYPEIQDRFQNGDYPTALDFIALVTLSSHGGTFLSPLSMSKIIQCFINKNIYKALEHIENYLQHKPYEFPLLIRKIACLLKLNRVEEARDVIILTMRLSLRSLDGSGWKASWVYGWCLYFLALAESNQELKLELLNRAIDGTKDCDVKAFAAWEVMKSMALENLDYAKYKVLADGYSKNRSPIIPLDFFEE